MIINLGCGNKFLEGAINHDRTKHAAWVDVAHNLNSYPWPGHTNSADEIIATDVLEHLDSFIGSFDECWRILNADGACVVQFPR